MHAGHFGWKVAILDALAAVLLRCAAPALFLCILPLALLMTTELVQKHSVSGGHREAVNCS